MCHSLDKREMAIAFGFELMQDDYAKKGAWKFLIFDRFDIVIIEKGFKYPFEICSPSFFPSISTN